MTHGIESRIKSFPFSKLGSAIRSAEYVGIYQYFIFSQLPNYTEMDISCSAIPGFYFDSYDIPGIKLLQIRSKDELTVMSKKKKT